MQTSTRGVRMPRTNTQVASFLATSPRARKNLENEQRLYHSLVDQEALEAANGYQLKTSHPPKPILLVNIKQLVTLRSSVYGPRRGKELGELQIVHDGAVLCSAGK